jgi:hypothetical protein
MPNEKEFRVHHILCTQLYRGLGYSGDFCTNMTAIVSDLRANPEQKVRLVAEAMSSVRTVRTVSVRISVPMVTITL